MPMTTAAAMLSPRHNWLFAFRSLIPHGFRCSRFGLIVSRCALLLLLLVSFGFAGSANETTPGTFRAGVSEVRVVFFTTDGKNRPVEAIQKDDLAIVDSGTVIREFRSLTRSEETALDVVIMIDASESVAAGLHKTLDDVLQLIAQQPVSSEDNISVLSFGGLQTALLCTGDCRNSNPKLLSVKAAGATPLFDALAYGSNFLSRHHSPAVRSVLILFSDGDDTISKTSASDAVQALIASGTLLYAIDLNKLDLNELDLNRPGQNQSGARAQASSVLQRMAEATGGRYFSSRESAANVLQAALEDLRASYVVTYQLPNSVLGFHSLRILPKHNLNLEFHCRGGYYYGPSFP